VQINFWPPPQRPLPHLATFVFDHLQRITHAHEAHWIRYLPHTWYSACTAFGEAGVPTPGLEGGVGCNPRVTFDGKVRNLGLGVLKFGSSDGQDAQSRIVLPPETGDQPSSLSSGLSDAPRLNRRRPGYLYSIIEYE
jgi:hypothetical protein